MDRDELEHRGRVSHDHWHAHVTDANVVYALSHPPRSGAQPAPLFSATTRISSSCSRRTPCILVTKRSDRNFDDLTTAHDAQRRMEHDEALEVAELHLSVQERIQLAISRLPVLAKEEIPLDDSCPICINSFEAVLEGKVHEGLGEALLELDELAGVTKLVGCGHIFCRAWYVT